MTSVELPVVRWGVGERRVLLVHGLGSSAQTWWRVGSRLANEGWSVTAPDLRGHGRAPVAESYAFADMAADLQALGGGWDVVVGHSLGGALVVAAAGMPGWAGRLLLVDPVLRIADDRFDAIREAELADVETSSVEAVLAAHPAWHPEDARLKVLALEATSRHVVERVFADNRPWDLVADLGRLGLPVHVIGADPLVGGMLDPVLGLELADTHPHLAFELAIDRGHSLHREDPNLVVDGVDAVYARPPVPS